MSPVVYSETLFLGVLSREEAMTQRCDHSFTLLTFDLRQGPVGARAAKALERAASGAIRESDIAGWLGKNCLGIILPAASALDAEKLRQRIVRLLPSYAAHLRCSTQEYKPGASTEGLPQATWSNMLPTAEDALAGWLQRGWVSPWDRLNAFVLRLLL